MSTAFERIYHLASAEQTADFASRLAPRLLPGDVILLHGGPGAGKTHVARTVIQQRLAAIGVAEDIPSPTFTLVQVYEDGVCEIWHADLYRLTNVDEVAELGLEDAFDTSICLVEWPDRLGDAAPVGCLQIFLAMTEVPGERVLRATSTDARWADVLGELDG